MRIETLNQVYKVIAVDYAASRFISRKTGLLFSTVNKVIHYLLCLGVVDKKKVGNTFTYRIKQNITLNDIIQRYTQL